MTFLQKGLFSTLFVTAASIAAAQGMDHGTMNMDMMKGCMQGMQMMDADEDGTISKDEFMQAHGQMFTTMDKDGDGALSTQEAESMMGKCCGEMSGGHPHGNQH